MSWYDDNGDYDVDGNFHDDGDEDDDGGDSAVSVSENDWSCCDDRRMENNTFLYNDPSCNMELFGKLFL